MLRLQHQATCSIPIPAKSSAATSLSTLPAAWESISRYGTPMRILLNPASSQVVSQVKKQFCTIQEYSLPLFSEPAFESQNASGSLEL